MRYRICSVETIRHEEQEWASFDNELDAYLCARGLADLYASLGVIQHIFRCYRPNNTRDPVHATECDCLECELRHQRSIMQPDEQLRYALRVSAVDERYIPLLRDAVTSDVRAALTIYQGDWT